MSDYVNNLGCNINRGGYDSSYDVAMKVLEARQKVAEFFHSQNPQDVVFTPSITYSLNILLQGFLNSGDHIITTSMEHNSVMRPLFALSEKGVDFKTVQCEKDGTLNPENIKPLIKKNTKAIVLLHASNVCGTVMPIDEVAKICKENGIKLIVDAAQTAGVIDIDVKNIDALAFTGHKNLLAPQGIGGFIIKKDFAEKVRPLIYGGTGSMSHEFEQPSMLPDKFESGTINIPGILALKSSIEYITSIGIENIYEKEIALANKFISMLQEIDGIEIIGKPSTTNVKTTPVSESTKKPPPDRVAVVSLNFPGKDNAEIASILDKKYGIMTRCGLHCAPNAHKTLDTYPHGTIRFSFGFFNTTDEVKYIVESIENLI